MKTWKCQICWKPSILLTKAVPPCSTDYDVVWSFLDWQLSCSMIFQKLLQVRTCQMWWKIGKWQTIRKPSIFFLRAVTTTLIRSSWQLGLLVIDNSLALLYCENCMFGPVKCEETSNLSNLLENIHTTSHSLINSIIWCIYLSRFQHSTHTLVRFINFIWFHKYDSRWHQTLHHAFGCQAWHCREYENHN